MSLFGPPNIERLQTKGRVKRLIKVLSYRRDADIRRRAIIALGELGKPGQLPMPKAVEALVDKLQAQEYRCECAVALGQIGDVRAVDALLVTLQDADVKVRAAAATALGAIQDGRAIQSLMNHFGDADESVRQAVLEALQAMGAETDDILQQALHDEDATLQQGAIMALEARAWEPGQDAASAEYWILKAQWDKVAEIGEPAVTPLLEALHEPATATSVAQTLGEIGDARALEPLCSLMSDSRDGVRLAAVQALDTLALPAALPALLQGLEDSSVKVRAVAAKALCDYPSDDVTAPLVNALNDEEHEVRSAAAKALQDVSNPSSAPALVDALADDHQPVRMAAEGALDSMPSEFWPQIMPLLTAVLSDANRSLRNSAAKLLDHYDWQPTSDAVGAAYHIIRRNWEEVAALGAVAAVPLVAIMHESYARKNIVELLPEIGQQAVAPLVKALGHADPDVQQAAAQTLGAIGDQSALGPLLGLVLDDDLPEAPQEIDGKPPSQTEIRRHERVIASKLAAREAAADALGVMGQAAVPSLVSQLKASDQQDEALRRLLAQALARAGAPAVEPLIAILGDEALAPIATQALIDAGEPAVEPLVSALSNGNLRDAAVQVLANMDMEATQHLATIANQIDDALTQDGLRQIAVNILDADRFALLVSALQPSSAEPEPAQVKAIASLLSHGAVQRTDSREALGANTADLSAALASARQASALLAQAEETVDAEQALRLAREALLSAPTFSAAWVTAASIIRRRLEAPEIALGWVMQAMALLDEDAVLGSEDESGEGDNPHAWVELGLIHVVLSDPISATSVFSAATMIAPELDDVTPWLYLIEVYRQMGRVDEMYAAIQSAQSLGAQIPEDLDADWAALVASIDRQAFARMLDEVTAMGMEEEPA